MGLNKQKGNINQIRKANHIILNNQLYEMLDGLLLGDGTLTTQRQNISAFYEHGDKHLDFLLWLSNQFDDLAIRQSGRIYYMNDVKNGAWKYKTLTYYELGSVRERWYPKGYKSIPMDLKLTPTILKLWYIGDGNFCRQPLIDSSVFDMFSLNRLSLQLEDIGITHTLKEYSDRRRIRVLAKSEKDFFDYITSDKFGIPECYLYKFPGEVLSCQ